MIIYKSAKKSKNSGIITTVEFGPENETMKKYAYRKNPCFLVVCSLEACAKQLVLRNCIIENWMYKDPEMEHRTDLAIQYATLVVLDILKGRLTNKTSTLVYKSAMLCLMRPHDLFFEYLSIRRNKLLEDIEKVLKLRKR